jgi:hypothetical protein
MTLRSMANRMTSGAVLFASIMFVCSGQAKTTTRRHSTAIRRHSTPNVVVKNSASYVAVEMCDGKLSPDSRPGDAVSVRLKEDVRSNGEVILKKGTNITGVVRNVRRAEDKGEWKSEAQSMIQIEWRAPASEPREVDSVSFVLQSVIQNNHTSEYRQNKSLDDFTLLHTATRSSSIDARPVRAGGLLESTSAGGATATTATASATTPAATEPDSPAAVNSRANIALLNMPYVVAVDQQTGVSIETALGIQTSGQLFNVGHGHVVSSDGSEESVELYSHLINDTVITSLSKNFEISSGAQMQMLVGVNRK